MRESRWTDLPDPLRIQTAARSGVVAARIVVVSRLRARMGAIAFTGEYRWEPAAVRPHKFKIAIPKAEAAELERILAPTMVRERGFFARTLRLGPAPVPDWLKNRRADGTLSIDALTVGDSLVRVEGARVLWDGAAGARLVRLDAHADQTAVNGELAVDLSGHAPHYRFDGKLGDVPYKGGKLDFEERRGGGWRGAGPGDERAWGGTAERTVNRVCAGRGFSHGDGVFRTDAGAAVEDEAGLRSVAGRGDVYGDGRRLGTDGRVVLDLVSRGRQIRFTSVATVAGGQP